jgi:hypothetical protein
MHGFNVLKSAAHNVCHSYLGGTHYRSECGDLVCLELLRLIRESWILEAEIEFVAGSIEPRELESDAIRASVEDYGQVQLPRIVESQRRSMDEIKELTLYLHARECGQLEGERLLKHGAEYELQSVDGRRHKAPVESMFGGYSPVIEKPSWVVVIETFLRRLKKS